MIRIEAVKLHPGNSTVTASAGELFVIALLGPLLVPVGLLALRLVAAAFGGEPPPAAEWQLLLVLGPALPLYVALLPMLPLGIVKLRRGWRPRRSSLLLACLGLGIVLDALFYWTAA